MSNVVSFLARHKYYAVSAVVALMVILGVSGSFGVTSTADLELTSGGGTVAGECIINGPYDVVCVPSRTPKGSALVSFYEDGSSVYENGSKYDPDTQSFR